MKENKQFYINVCFAIFITVLTAAVLKDAVFHSTSNFISGFASLIGAALGFGLAWLLRNKSIIIKIIVLAIYIAVIAIVAHIKKNNSSLNNVSINVAKTLKGKWITKEDSLLLKLNIADTTMEMNFSPNNKQLVFEYEIQGDTVEFFNDDEVDYFKWTILKLTNDSLVVMEKQQVLRFKKQ